MKKYLLHEKGSIFIITLNVIIILTIFLFSFSFNSLSRYRLLTNEVRSYQAYLDAKSGILMAMKELKEGKLPVPSKKQYPLFDDALYQADVTMEYAALDKKDNEVRIIPGAAGGAIRITSIGKYRDSLWQITILQKNGRQLFYYSEPLARK
jgi:hypothetical protein